MDIDLTETINELESEMITAANDLKFEKAALLRDQIKELKRALEGPQPGTEITLPPAKRTSYTKRRKNTNY